MSDDPDLPENHDTPPDHVVLAINIELDLTPEWWEVILEVASKHVRRMMTVEKPDEWIVRVELHKERVAAFSADLGEAWDGFVEKRKAEGTWNNAE